MSFWTIDEAISIFNILFVIWRIHIMNTGFWKIHSGKNLQDMHITRGEVWTIDICAYMQLWSSYCVLWWIQPEHIQPFWLCARTRWSQDYIFWRGMQCTRGVWISHSLYEVVYESLSLKPNKHLVWNRIFLVDNIDQNIHGDETLEWWIKYQTFIIWWFNGIQNDLSIFLERFT